MLRCRAIAPSSSSRSSETDGQVARSRVVCPCSISAHCPAFNGAVAPLNLALRSMCSCGVLKSPLPLPGKESRAACCPGSSRDCFKSKLFFLPAPKNHASACFYNIDLASMVHNAGSSKTIPTVEARAMTTARLPEATGKTGDRSPKRE